MKTIPLSRGLEALVDDSDYELLIKYRWYASPGKRTWYADTRIYKPNWKDGSRVVKMHRMILGIADLSHDVVQVDHIDGNGINNHLANLRMCDVTMNLGNRGRISRNAGFKGVRFLDRLRDGRHPWLAQIKFRGKGYHLGYYASPVEAALAYDAAAVRVFGEFARTNKMLGLL